nr:hypothetical protein [Tanacetum cinerariifolium]
MSNTNNTMQTQTSNTLHNAIMEAGGKDRSPMLAPGNYVQWKSIIKRYIDTKHNHELIHYCLKNPPYNYTWADKTIPVSEGIDNDIYSTVDACPNACEMWKAIERLKQARSQQTATRNRGKEIVNSPPPIYDQEPFMVIEDDEMSKDKEIDKLMALISLSFKKYTNLPTTTFELHQSPVEQIRIILQGLAKALEQADWRDDTDDEFEDRELEAHYMYMAQIQEVTPDVADNSGPIFDSEPLQKVSNDDNCNVFAIESEHPKQSKYVNDTYLIEQDEHNVIIDSLDMSYDREQIDQDDDDDLASERDLLASLIEKLKCEIDDSKNRNKFLETSNKVLVDKLKETNELMYKDLKKFQAELDRRNDVKYASKINDLNQTILDMKNELFAHQETISILSQQKEAQIKFHKTREDKELDKVIALEKKVKVLDNIVYKTGQSFQTMNMLNHNCKTSFAKLVFLKKAQRANPRLYDIGCYNDNLV